MHAILLQIAASPKSILYPSRLNFNKSFVQKPYFTFPGP